MPKRKVSQIIHKAAAAQRELLGALSRLSASIEERAQSGIHASKTTTEQVILGSCAVIMSALALHYIVKAQSCAVCDPRAMQNGILALQGTAVYYLIWRLLRMKQP